MLGEFVILRINLNFQLRFSSFSFLRVSSFGWELLLTSCLEVFCKKVSFLNKVARCNSNFSERLFYRIPSIANVLRISCLQTMWLPSPHGIGIKIAKFHLISCCEYVVETQFLHRESK